MFGSAYRGQGNALSTTPAQFKENARNAIYQQLPPTVIKSNGAASIRSAPLKTSTLLNGSSSSLIFSKLSGRRSRSIRSAPSIYLTSTATIPEDAEPILITVEQLVQDIMLHEKHFKDQNNNSSRSSGFNGVDFDDEEMYKISLGSDLQYQHNESLVDWNLNVTRCKLLLVQLPMMSTVDGCSFQYLQNILPQLVGDLAQLCQIVLIQPHITDKELIYTLVLLNLYEEHDLDIDFKKLVAEISVKQSRLLQINERSKSQAASTAISQHSSFLKFKFKEIAIRNYLINLAAAATTAREYKDKTEQMKAQMREQSMDGKVKLSKEAKKILWEEVRLDVFRRAGLE